MLLAAASSVAHRVAPAPASTSSSDLIGPLPVATVFAIVAALLLWVVVYMLYRLVMTRRKDFGMPVRRRVLCRKLRIDQDQAAEAPFWWTDLQIQLAVSNHWRQTLRRPFVAGNDPNAPL